MLYLDPEIRDILCLYGRAECDDLVDKLAGCADMKVLMKTRDSIFRAAMDKVDLSLSLVAKARDDDTCSFTPDEESMIEKAEYLLKCLTPNDMIQRKCIRKLSGDIMNLMIFTCGSEEDFPAKILRHVSTFTHKMGAQDSSITEAIAFLQHVAGLTQCGPDIPDDLVTPRGGTLGINTGECSDLSISRDTFGGNDECVMADPSPTAHEITHHSEDHVDNAKSNSSSEDESEESTRKTEAPATECNPECVVMTNDPTDRHVNMRGQSEDNSGIELMQGVNSPGRNGDINQRLPQVSTTGTQISSMMECSERAAEEESTPELKTPPITHSTTTGANLETKMYNSFIANPIGSIFDLPEPTEPDDHGRYSLNPTGNPYGVSHEQHLHTDGKADANEPTPSPVCEMIGVEPDNMSESTCHANQYAQRVQSESELGHSRQDPQVVNVTSGIHVGERNFDSQTESVPNFPDIKISISFGNFSAVLDIADCMKMDGKSDKDKGWSNSRTREPTKQPDECRRCETRMDAQDRRIDDLEDAIAERMRRMMTHRGDPTPGEESVSRRVSVADTGPRNGAAAAPDAYVPGPHLSGEAYAFVKDKRVRKHGDLSSRSRAETFSGVPNRSNSRTRGERDDRNLRGPPTAERRENAEDPKPQRVRTTKASAKPRRRNDDQVKSRDNPIRDWLSTAKGDVRDPPMTPAAPTRPRRIETSPSWADEPVNDEDEDDTSESLTPTPMMRDAISPTSTLSPESVDRSSQEEGDCDIPPSGQVSALRTRRQDTLPRSTEANGAYGGARPKTRRGKMSDQGNKTNTTGSNKGNVKSNDNRKQPNKAGTTKSSYASAVATTKWKTMQSKKRKFEKVSPKLTFPLKGKPSTCNRDVYLQGLDVGDGNGSEDMMESVRSYCVDKGVTPLYIRIIPVRYDCTRVGCRLTISEEDFERVMDELFWPDDVSVREWTPKPRDNRGNGEAGARPPSDNDD